MAWRVTKALPAALHLVRQPRDRHRSEAEAR